MALRRAHEWDMGDERALKRGLTLKTARENPYATLPDLAFRVYTIIDNLDLPRRAKRHALLEIGRLLE